MAKRSFVQKTQRTIVGAAKSSAVRVQRIAVRAATAAATAAAEAAVAAVMKSFVRSEGRARGRKTGRTAGRKPARRRQSTRKTTRTTTTRKMARKRKLWGNSSLARERRNGGHRQSKKSLTQKAWRKKSLVNDRRRINAGGHFDFRVAPNLVNVSQGQCGALRIARMRRNLRIRCATDTFLGCTGRRAIFVDPGMPASIITLLSQKWRQAISAVGAPGSAASTFRLDWLDIGTPPGGSLLHQSPARRKVPGAATTCLRHFSRGTLFMYF
jgi:hypothetical protein